MFGNMWKDKPYNRDTFLLLQVLEPGYSGMTVQYCGCTGENPGPKCNRYILLSLLFEPRVLWHRRG